VNLTESGRATNLIIKLEQILKPFYLCATERKHKIESLIQEFRGKREVRWTLTELYTVILTKDERINHRLRQYPKSPFPYVTNVEHFSTATGSWHTDLLEYGIKTRGKWKDQNHNGLVGSKIHLLYLMNINYRCNQYLKKQ